MIFEVADLIRRQVLTATGLAPARSFVAPSEQWARESCLQWVVHYATSRRVTVGEGRQPAVQGAGLAGQCASVPVLDLVATWVGDCYPVGDNEGNPAAPAEIHEWTRTYLEQVDAIDAALSDAGAFSSQLLALGLTSGITIGATQPFGPSGMVARTSWPLSINGF